ncbi:hypothetical protein BD311DRAFT_752131 [Dichomitus squalens]|uniref:F-box domain-containing protein n=1 Tax=Dichomitus squalens TaxID=114155 RepID=A0A4Q9MV91_9APHY|nr:hypothetical protein BD311DRAFT_752131 [Dichomitus squalens]
MDADTPWLLFCPPSTIRAPLIMFASLVYEVVVEIVDQLQDDVNALRLCALTCRQLRSWSRCHLCMSLDRCY